MRYGYVLNEVAEVQGLLGVGMEMSGEWRVRDMRRGVLLSGLIYAVVMLPVVLLAAGGVKRIYVSPTGSDGGSGSRWRPYGSFERAQRAVAEMKGDPAGAPRRIEVLFKGGRYELERAVEITPESGGSEGCEVVYKARGGKMPVFMGGRVIKGWQVGSDGAWRVELPQVRAGEWNFAQLFVDGSRRFRPRLPKSGFYTTEDNYDADDEGVNGFYYQSNNLSAAWANLPDIEFHVLHVWSAGRLRASRIDEANTNLTFSAKRKLNRYWCNFKKRRYWVENVKEALGSPGEWYLDRPTGVLTYIPLAGESARRSVVEVPMLGQTLIVRGSVEEQVVSTTLEGLEFRLSQWVTPPEGNYVPQGEVNAPAAVEVVHTRGLTLRSCAFTQLGGYAVAFGPGAHSNTVDSCVMHDLGAGGVKIGSPYMGYSSTGEPKGVFAEEPLGDVSKSTSATTIINSRISGGGRIHPSAHGVWIGRSSWNRVVHNVICDLFYSSVGIGWNWGYVEPSRAHHNEIGYNHMYLLGQGILSDMGGVYTLGVSPGTTIHNNVIHDIYAYDYGGWGLYTDEGSTGIRMWNNLVYNTKTGSFHQHYGRENVLENNIFVNSIKQQLQRTRKEEHVSFMMRNNIIYWENGSPLLGSNWSSERWGESDGVARHSFELSSNLYWSVAGGEEIFPGKRTLGKWQEEMGQDMGSVVADPLFVDVAAGDFRFREGSPYEQVGFKPFDVKAAGLREPALLPAVRIERVPAMYEPVEVSD